MRRGISSYFISSVPSLNANFKMTVDTTLVGSASNTFILPFNNVGTYSCIVYWGDGNSDVITTYNDAALTHIYDSSGSYQISISGVFGQVKFNNGGDKLKPTSIDNWGTNVWADFANSFYGCYVMTSNYVDAPDLSNVTTVKNCFRDCDLFGSVDGFDVSNILDFSNSLYSCNYYNYTMDSWQLSIDGSDILMASVLRGTIFNQYLGSWDIRDVISFAGFARAVTSWSDENYGDTLAGWVGWTGGIGGTATRPVRKNVAFRCGSGVPLGSDGEYARAYLIATEGWTFQDYAPR